MPGRGSVMTRPFPCLRAGRRAILRTKNGSEFSDENSGPVVSWRERPVPVEVAAAFGPVPVGDLLASRGPDAVMREDVVERPRHMVDPVGLAHDVGVQRHAHDLTTLRALF